MSKSFSPYLDLLESGSFDELEQEIEAFRNEENDPHKIGPLVILQSCGLSRVQYLYRWVSERPDSGYAWAMLGKYWWNKAYEARGTGTTETITSSMAELSTLAIDLSARALFQGLNTQSGHACLAEYFLEMLRHFRLPNWAHDPECAEDDHPEPENAFDLAEESALEKMRALGWDSSLPVPNIDPKFLKDPEKSLVDLNFGINPQGHAIPYTMMHYLRPRWGGSYEQMEAFLDSPYCLQLSDEHKDYLETIIKLDPFEGFWPDYVDRDTFNHYINHYDKICREARHPRAKAYVLAQKGLFLDCEDKGRDAHSVLKESYALHPKSDADEELIATTLRFEPNSSLLYKVASDINLYGEVKGALVAGLCCEKGLGGQSIDKDLAKAWFERAYDLNPFSEDWADLALDIMEERPDLALTLLERGVEFNAPGVFGELADAYFSGYEIEKDYEKAKYYAEMGVKNNDVSAMIVAARIDYHDADDQAEERKSINALIGIFNEHESEEALEKALEYLDDANIDHKVAFELSSQAFEREYDWSYGHLAFHYCFGIGVIKDKKVALEIVDTAFDDGLDDHLLRRVKKAASKLIDIRFTRPKKESTH